MSLDTFSIFYYGHEVTAENNLFDFDEGFGTVVGEISVGTYSLTNFAIALRDALNTFGTLTYQVLVDRDNRKLTIQASGTFDLLISSGPSTGTSAYPLIGFTGNDLTGLSTYTANNESGYEYRPQFKLQDHVPKENYKKTVSASVNESASGEVEVVRFGNVRFTEFNIRMITNKKMDGIVIKNNPSGVEDANDFMDYITKVAPIEFMPDISDRNTSQTLQIESTVQSKDGIDYKLKELYDRGLPGIYETGLLTFRVLD